MHGGGCPKTLTETAEYIRSLHKADGLWYLASPYSHPRAFVREERFRAVARVTAALRSVGVFTFCPIAHTHPVQEQGLFSGFLSGTEDSDFWLEWDRKFFPFLEGMITCMLPGWEKSYGVGVEIKEFAAAEKPVIYLQPKMLFTGVEWKILGEGNV
jgi:hypothetical protein